MKHIISCALLLLVLAFSACQPNGLDFTSQPTAVQDSTNELRMHIDFELTQKSTAYVSFWSISNPTKKYYSPLSDSASSHHITLIGLKGETTYKYQIHTSHEHNEMLSDIGTFTTDKFPINILHLRWESESIKGLTGYILSQRRLVNGSLYMLDEDGDIVWYQTIPKQPKLSHWTDRSTILVLYGAAGHRNSSGDHIVEYDLWGKGKSHIDLSALDQPIEAHHEVRFDKNHELLTLIYQHKTYDLSAIGGPVDQSIMGDKIVKMDTSGQVLWEWSVFDHLDPTKDPTILKTAKDWSHANSLSIDKDGNYLISFRNFNQVWKVDAQSGNVIWKLGDGGDINMDSTGYFYGQHAFHVNADGDYMVFDNGRKDRQSRVLTFQLDEKKRSGSVKVNLPLAEDLYADKMGNAYLMDNGHILACIPRSNSLLILNQKGEVLARAHVGIPAPYRAEFVDQLYALDHVR